MLCVQRAEDFVKVCEREMYILCHLNEERKQKKIENNWHGISELMKLLDRLGRKNIAICGKR